MAIDRAGLASDAFTITASDATTQRAAAVYVGVAGNVAVKTEDGTSVIFVGATAGSILPIKTLQILSTGTTATSLIGLR